MAESKEELKSLLMRVKKESEKAALKLSIQKTKIMSSGRITSWQINGETMEIVADFISLGSKITADSDCSHETKRLLLLGRKTMKNLDSVLKSRDTLLPTNIHLVKAMVFPLVMCGYDHWTIRKVECPRIIVQLSHPHMTTGKTIALTRQTFVDKVISLLINMLPRLVITFLSRSKHL